MNLKLIYLIENQFYKCVSDVAKSGVSYCAINRDRRLSLKVGEGRGGTWRNPIHR